MNHCGNLVFSQKIGLSGPCSDDDSNEAIPVAKGFRKLGKAMAYSLPEDLEPDMTLPQVDSSLDDETVQEAEDLEDQADDTEESLAEMMMRQMEADDALSTEPFTFLEAAERAGGPVGLQAVYTEYRAQTPLNLGIAYHNSFERLAGAKKGL